MRIVYWMTTILCLMVAQGCSDDTATLTSSMLSSGGSSDTSGDASGDGGDSDGSGDSSSGSSGYYTLSKIVYYDETGTISNTGTLEYDDQGRVVRSVNKGADGNTTSESKVYFDSDNRVIKQEDLTDGFTQYYSYDDSGRLIKEEWDDEGDGVMNSTYDYSYDATGNADTVVETRNGSTITSYYNYNAENQLTEIESGYGYTRKYNYTNGKMVEEIVDRNDGNPYTSQIVEYDGDKIIKMSDYDPGDVLTGYSVTTFIETDVCVSPANVDPESHNIDEMDFIVLANKRKNIWKST
jgi:YD repeat-containing protein